MALRSTFVGGGHLAAVLELELAWCLGFSFTWEFHVQILQFFQLGRPVSAKIESSWVSKMVGASVGTREQGHCLPVAPLLDDWPLHAPGIVFHVDANFFRHFDAILLGNQPEIRN